MLNFLLNSPEELLSPGTRLVGGTYIINKVLGQGGFGITYLANDSKLQRSVAIKELFPRMFVTRQGKQVSLRSSTQPSDYEYLKKRFIEEAHALSRFNHPGIVNVYAVFEENNTAYITMEFLNGKTLQKLVKEQGKLPEKQAIAYIEKIGEALTIVHQANLLHRDIKPDNIIVTDNGRVVLIDFGAARAFVADKTQQMTAIYTDGYAPLEQYASKARTGPYTDIYALGATLYYLLTGKEPVSSPNRNCGVELPSVRKLNPEVSDTVAHVVMQAMEMKYEQRPQSVRDFLSKLVAKPGLIRILLNIVGWVIGIGISLLGLLGAFSYPIPGILFMLMDRLSFLSIQFPFG
ncbi:protein kinase [Scytonema sp. UIC 10036]|uniref:serine/threonine protein kinase n=1 Tax=Scytonema sp. UIC 10036 TaxID=2304196 RepID=UPI0012DA0DA6|nr:serine/threonine-protein kinase [Scytonema sp. UIC 10036]MUG96849.1 protein kinase [Scytonema sp. UIC 10036]